MFGNLKGGKDASTIQIIKRNYFNQHMFELYVFREQRK